MCTKADLNKARILNCLKKQSNKQVTWECGKKQRQHLHKFRIILNWINQKRKLNYNTYNK
jgi:hypothetical protein